MNDPPNREVVVFNAALQLPTGERAAYLSERCHDDPELRRRVATLLQAHDRAGAFLQEPPGRSAAPSELNGDRSDREPPGETCGDRVGHYKLLQQIGEGGCGVVYMAEQEKPVRRRVALKVSRRR